MKFLKELGSIYVSVNAYLKIFLGEIVHFMRCFRCFRCFGMVLNEEIFNLVGVLGLSV